MKNRFLAIYKELEYPTILALFLCGLCFHALSFLNKEFGFIERSIILAFCYISAMKFPSHWRKYQLMQISKWEKRVFVPIWLCATFAIAGIHFIGMDRIDVYFSLRYYIFTAMWIGPIVLWGFIILCDSSFDGVLDREISTFSLREKAFMMGGILFVCIVMLIAFNPGITTIDSERCYANAYDIIQGDSIPGQHPFFYAFLLSVLLRINTSISFMIFVQYVFFALVCLKGLNVLRQLGISKKYCIMSFFFFSFGYNTIILLTSLWKDIPFTISILWFTILSGEYAIKWHFDKIPLRWYAEIIVAGIFVGFIRHGGLIPVFGTMFFLFIVSREKLRMGFCVFALIVATIFVKIPLHDYLQVNDSGLAGLRFSALTSDVEYVYYNGGSLDTSASKLVLLATDYKPMEPKYDPWYSWNEWRKDLGKYTMKDFIPVYVGTFIQNPILMTKGFLIRCNYLWTISKPKKGRESCVENLTESHEVEDSLSVGIPKRTVNILTKVISWIVFRIGNLPFVHIVYWRVGLYNVALMALLLLILAKGKGFFKFAVPFFPIFFNVFVLVFGCAWPSYRYFWPCMMCCSFLIPYGILTISGAVSANGEEMHNKIL